MAKETKINLRIETNAQNVINELKRLKDSTIEGSDAFKKLEKEIEDLEKASNKYKDTLIEMEIAQNNGEKSTKRFKDNIKQAENELKSLTKSASQSTNSLKGFASASKQASDAWGDLSDGIGSLRSGDLAGGLSSITSGIQGMTKASLAFIATPIGATITALAGIAVGAKALWDYNSAMSESNKITQQFTGLTGDALNAVDVKTQTLMSQSGASQEEVLRSVQALVTQFGISYDEAFDKIETGYLKSGKSAEDFFDNIAEYSTQFDNAGYTAEEMFGIIEAGAQSGVYKDKILDSVKEMDIALREMPKASKEALEQAFGTDFANKLSQGINSGAIKSKDAIQLIGEEAKRAGLSVQDQATLTADVFKSAGEDAGGFSDVINVINNGLDNSKKELDAVKQAQKESNDAQSEMNMAFRNLFGSTEGGFAKMKADLMGGVYKGITTVINGVIDTYNWFVELYNQSYAFRGVIGSIGAIAKTSFNIIMANLRGLVNGFKSLGELIQAVFTGNFGDIPSIIGRAFNNTKEIFVQAGKDSADSFVDAWDEKGDRLKKIEKTSTKILETESDKRTETEITNSNKVTNNHEKNEKKKRTSSKKTTDAAKKDLEAYNKHLEELSKTINELSTKNGIGGLSKTISDSVSDFKRLSDSITEFNELINKTKRTEEEENVINKFLNTSIMRSALEGKKTLDNVRGVIVNVREELQKLNSEYQRFIKWQGDDSEDAKKLIPLIAQYETQMQALVPIEQQAIKSLMAFNEFQKLTKASKELDRDTARGGKRLMETLEDEMNRYINGKVKELPTKLTEFSGWKHFVDNVKDISEETWQIFAESQPDGTALGLKMVYDKWKKDQEELNKLTEDYKKKWEEINPDNLMKGFDIKEFERNFSLGAGLMETLGGGGAIFSAKSKSDMEAELDAIEKHNIDLIETEMMAELKKLEALGASEEQKQDLLNYYNQLEIEQNQKKADALIEIDQLTAQRREAALSQTADTLSQASELFAEHTTAYKVFAIAAATIDTYQSAMAAYKGMVAAIPGPWGIAAGVAAAASSVAFGIKQIKEITKVDTGDGGSSGGNSVANVTQSPNVQFVSSGDNQIAQTIAGSQNSSEELQVTVLATDISNALTTQAKVKNNAGM